MPFCHSLTSLPLPSISPPVTTPTSNATQYVFLFLSSLRLHQTIPQFKHNHIHQPAISHPQHISNSLQNPLLNLPFHRLNTQTLPYIHLVWSRASQPSVARVYHFCCSKHTCTIYPTTYATNSHPSFIILFPDIHKHKQTTTLHNRLRNPTLPPLGQPRHLQSPLNTFP